MQPQEQTKKFQPNGHTLLFLVNRGVASMKVLSPWAKPFKEASATNKNAIINCFSYWKFFFVWPKIDWLINDSLKANDKLMPARKIVIISRHIRSELIFHSDWGVQTCSNNLAIFRKTYHIVSLTMIRKKECSDIFVAENFL